jgi:hypothetical protein
MNQVRESSRRMHMFPLVHTRCDDPRPLMRWNVTMSRRCPARRKPPKMMVFAFGRRGLVPLDRSTNRNAGNEDGTTQLLTTGEAIRQISWRVHEQ